MNNNTIESIRWHKDQLLKLLSDEDNFYKVESELDDIIEKAKTKKPVLVRRGGKTFYREQEVGSDKDESTGWKIPVDKFVDNYLKSKKLDYKTSKESDMEYNTKRLAGVDTAVGMHAKIIKTAVSDGKKIPKNVLKDYPMYKK